MKNTIAIFTALVLCLVVMAGCGGQTTTSAISSSNFIQTESVSSVSTSSEIANKTSEVTETSEEFVDEDPDFVLEMMSGEKYKVGETIIVSADTKIMGQGSNYLIVKGDISGEPWKGGLLKDYMDESEKILTITTTGSSGIFYIHKYTLKLVE